VRISLGDRAMGALQAELLGEKMDSLSRASRAAADALAKLAAFDGDAETRETLVDEAASKVWSFMVQRELCGFMYDVASLRDMNVPPEVMARLGVARKKP
jgi:MoxR-like ATPase